LYKYDAINFKVRKKESALEQIRPNKVISEIKLGKYKKRINAITSENRKKEFGV